MSNKKWCMPNYPLRKMLLEKNPELKKDLPHIPLYKAAKFSIYKNQSHEKAMPYIAEAELIRKNTPCLFVQTKSLVNFLYESTYSDGIFLLAVKDFTHKHICFPSMSINGINLRSCAFGVLSGAKIAVNQEDVVLFACGLPLDGFDCRYWPCDVIDSYLMNDSQCSIKFPQNYIAHLMIKLCLGVCVYAAAFPDCVIDGLPDDVKAPELHKPRILRAAPAILEGATRTSVSMHIRAGHFRCLRDDRFAHNDDGTPKVIFVKQHVVAGKLTPKTAVGL